MRPSNVVRVFGMAAHVWKGKPYLGVWSFNLRDILQALGKHLDGHFLVVTKADLHELRWLRKYQGGISVADRLKAKRIRFKSLRNGYAAFTHQEFTDLEPKIRKALKIGDFEFCDSAELPPYNLFPGCRTKLMKWSIVEPTIPTQIGATFNWHMHDGYMSIVTVSNDRLFRHMVERFLGQIIARAILNAKRTGYSRRARSVEGFDNVFWKKLRAILLSSGVTCARRDIKESRREVILDVWAGHPEWSDRQPGNINKSFRIRYSLGRSRWSLSSVKVQPFAYRQNNLLPFRR